MTPIKEQLYNDIEQLPEHILQAISIIIKEIVAVNFKHEVRQHPVFGSGKGQMWIAEDFDAPLEELKEYME